MSECQSNPEWPIWFAAGRCCCSQQACYVEHKAMQTATRTAIAAVTRTIPAALP